MKKLVRVCVLAGLLSSFAVADESLVLNQVKQDSVGYNGWKYYVVNGGASSIKLFNLSADLDLHVRTGARPTANLWDCRPYAGGSETEECNVNPNEVIYIGVHGYNSGTFSLVANGSSNGGGSQPPQPGNVPSSLLHVNAQVQQGDWKYYTINGGATSVKLHNLTADLDLHVKSGSRPDANVWDCRPYAGGTSDEICNVNPSEVIYIGIHGYESGSFTLDVTGQGSGGSGDNGGNQNSTVTQAFENATTNLGLRQGYVYWNNNRHPGVWADNRYTYCARFVRMCFGEPRKYASAKAMYIHFHNLNLVHTGTTPPKGAVVFYDSHRENWWFGHVGISDGSSHLYSADSIRRGVTKRNIHGSYRASYLGYVTANEFKQNH